MKFEKVLPALREGESVSRLAWRNEGLFLHISHDGDIIYLHHLQSGPSKYGPEWYGGQTYQLLVSDWIIIKNKKALGAVNKYLVDHKPWDLTKYFAELKNIFPEHE